MHVQRVELPEERNGLSFGRRIRTIWEIEDFDQYREVAVWNPRNDTFETWFEDSVLLERISEMSGQSKEAILNELEARAEYIKKLMEKEGTDQKEVAEMILAYQYEKQDIKRKFEKRSEPQPKTSSREDKISSQEEEIKKNEFDLNFSDLNELDFQKNDAEDDSKNEG
jgi:hypothetical protein